MIAYLDTVSKFDVQLQHAMFVHTNLTSVYVTFESSQLKLQNLADIDLITMQ